MYVRIRGGDYNASSGFGLWAKTLRGQQLDYELEISIVR